MSDKLGKEIEIKRDTSKSVFVSGVCINVETTRQLAKDFYGKEVRFEIMADDLNDGSTAEAREKKREIAFDRVIPVKIAQIYLRNFEEIVQYDFGLRKALPILETEETINVKASRKMAITVHSEGVLKLPTDILLGSEKDNEGWSYGRESTERFKQLVQEGLLSIDESKLDEERKEELKAQFMAKHLGRFMKIAEVSIASYYAGVTLHEIQHLVYAAEHKTEIASKQERLKDKLQTAKELAALVGIYGIGSGVGVGLFEGGEKMHLVFLKQLEAANLNSVYDIAVYAVAVSSILAGAGLGFKKAVDMSKVYFKERKTVRDEEYYQKALENEEIAYRMQAASGHFFKGAISINSEALWTQVFEDPQMAMLVKLE